MLHATPHQLGFDPTVTLLPTHELAGSDINYEIIVQTDSGERFVYRTLELLSAIIGGLQSKGTRVWKVTRIVNGEPFGDPAILKDSWVAEGRERETATFNRFASIDHPEEYKHTIGKSFLTSECYGDVYVHSGSDMDRLDCTRTNCIAARSVEMEENSPILQPATHHKVHHRMVVKEICRPIYAEVSLLHIFAALNDISTGKLN